MSHYVFNAVVERIAEFPFWVRHGRRADVVHKTVFGR